MNKNRNASLMEAKLIQDYFAAKAVDYSEIMEVFHKDDEVIVRYADSKGNEKFKTMKATELIAFAYDKSRNFSSGAILKEVQLLVGKKLEEIQVAVMAEIEKLKTQTKEEITRKEGEGNNTVAIV